MSKYIEKTKRVWGEPNKSYGDLQDYIKRLEDENARLKAERDVAMEDMCMECRARESGFGLRVEPIILKGASSKKRDGE